MSRILRRPMFRGGRASSYGTGIASGLANGGMPNKRGLVDGPGGYAGIGEEVLSMREEILRGIPERRGLSTSDYLRIASAGLDILGRPSEGGGISGALATASKPLAKLGTDIASSMDTRGQSRQDLATSLTGAGLDYKVGMAKADKKTATEVQLDVVDKFYDKKIASANDETEIATLNAKRDEVKLDIARGGNKASKFRILNPQTIVAVTETVQDSLGDDATLEEINEAVVEYLLRLVGDFDAGLAEGGSVTEDMNLMTATPAGITDVNVQETETVTNPQPTQISYDELRARLPQEITDDIVNLLATSYEALADFAEIATQSDVDNFNSKYGVELVLPQEA